MKVTSNKLVIVAVLLLGSTGCATNYGFGTADHNGKLYYFPKGCDPYGYNYDNPDVLICKETGQTIYPADDQQISNYQRQQQKKRQSIKDFTETLRNTAPKTTNTNCLNLGSSISCSSTTY